MTGSMNASMNPIMTINEIISVIVAEVPGAPFPETVDTIKSGDPSQTCTGMVTTFLATVEVIEQAAALNANFIITHEPTFYNHFDKAAWAEDIQVVRAKRSLLERYGIVVWRFHDYLHSLQPDPTMLGMMQALEWERYQDPDRLFACRIPPLSLRDLAAQVKQKLDLPYVRVIGDPDMNCQTIGILPGFPPNEMQIGLFDVEGVDALICGEAHEWETTEYTRDAIRLGSNKALLLIGHAASEEPGIRWITTWLREKLPNQTITFIPTGRLIQVV